MGSVRALSHTGDLWVLWGWSWGGEWGCGWGCGSSFVCAGKDTAPSLSLSLCVGLYPLVWIGGSASLLAGPPSRNSSSRIHQIKMEDALLWECWALVVRKEKSHVPTPPRFHCSLKSPHVSTVKFLASLYLAFIPKAWKNAQPVLVHWLSTAAPERKRNGNLSFGFLCQCGGAVCSAVCALFSVSLKNFFSYWGKCRA